MKCPVPGISGSQVPSFTGYRVSCQGEDDCSSVSVAGKPTRQIKITQPEGRRRGAARGGGAAFYPYCTLYSVYGYRMVLNIKVQEL